MSETMQPEKASFHSNAALNMERHCDSRNNSRSDSSGFTLIEVLIVMAIVALLLTIALPRYFGSVEKSKEVALKQNLQVLRSGIDKFYADKGHFPEVLEDLVTQKYFRSVPVDPITESEKTWILVPSQDAQRPGIEDVKSGAQGNTRDGVPYEQL